MKEYQIKIISEYLLDVRLVNEISSMTRVIHTMIFPGVELPWSLSRDTKMRMPLQKSTDSSA